MKRLTAFLFLLFSPYLYAAPKAEMWAYWNASNETNLESLSHQQWQSLLDKYLVIQAEYTLFKYSSVSQSDKLKLGQYLSTLSQIDPRQLNRSEQYAYWVNIYNALTVKLILDNYPVSSITKIGGWFSFGPWDDDIITIAGKTLTLNDIEHRILRPIWRDPRTHYAVNCASLGCPNLQSLAFTAKNSNALLEKAASAFINSDKGVRVENGELVLSSIYEWFVEDFGNREQLIAHITIYKTEGLSGYKEEIRYQYDWTLNSR